MKVVHINYSDAYGGAAIAAFRHCEAMCKAGIDATLLVCNKSRNDRFVYQIGTKSSKYKFLLKSVMTSKIINYIFQPWASFSYPFFTVPISKHTLLKEADIIYIHWVSNSMLSTKEIERILNLGIPVRWFMHDMNPITGGCHHAIDCDGYKSTCKSCPFISNPLGIQIAKIQYKKRKRLWTKYQNLEAYTPSHWLAKRVEESSLWKKHKVTVFPNVINTDKFRPMNNKISMRNILNLSYDKKMILIGAANLSSEYKGWKYLREALNKLDSCKYEALIFGHKNEQIENEVNIPCNFLGYLNDEIALIVAYNASDIFVSSSLAENYPNVIMEAMACGLPCVGFNIGGIPEQICHKVNGYIATPKDSEDLANGIEFICNLSPQKYQEMCTECRKFVVSKASYKLYKSFTC